MQYATKSISAGLVAHYVTTADTWYIQRTVQHTHTQTPSAPCTVTDLLLNIISMLSQPFIWTYESLVVFKVREEALPINRFEVL